MSAAYLSLSDSVNSTAHICHNFHQIEINHCNVFLSLSRFIVFLVCLNCDDLLSFV
jgi:hypothetical protein